MAHDSGAGHATARVSWPILTARERYDVTQTLLDRARVRWPNLAARMGWPFLTARGAVVASLVRGGGGGWRRTCSWARSCTRLGCAKRPMVSYGETGAW